MTPLYNVLTGRYTPPFEVLRMQNIKHIFITTIHPMDMVIDKYDYCLTRLCSRVAENKIDGLRVEINDRAYNLTLKLLD